MGLVYDYSRLRGSAKRLVTKFGTDAELRRQGGAVYPTKVVFTDYKASQINETLIKMGDFMGLIADSDIGTRPATGDKLFWEGKERQVVNVSVTKPGPQAVLYTLQLRGPR